MLKKIVQPGKIAFAPVALAIVLAGSARLIAAEDAPKDNKGFTASKTTVVDLGPEFPGTAGLQLRLRLLTIEPGGHIGLHSHKERPSVVYVIQGTDTVIRDDGSSQTLRAGDTAGEPGTTVHWHRNDGKDAVVAVAVDVLKASK